MSRKPSHRLVTGVFPDRTTAEQAYAAATQDGYTKDDVDVMMSDETRKKYFHDDAPDSELGTKAAAGAGVGGAIGGTLGAILGAVVATGTAIALPGPRPGDRRPAGGGASPARARVRSPAGSSARWSATAFRKIA